MPIISNSSTIENLRSALDILADNGHAEDYSKWNLVNLSLKTAVIKGEFSAEEGFNLLDEFSQKCPAEYNLKKNKTIWDGATSSINNPRGLGSIFSDAREYGWSSAKAETGDFSWIERLPHLNEIPTGPEGLYVPYFAEKGLSPPEEVKIYKDSALILYRDLEGELRAVLSVDPTKKKMLTGSTNGGFVEFYPLNSAVKEIHLTEGVGTGSAVREAYDDHFNCSGDAKQFIARQKTTAILSVGSKFNLKPVAQALRNAYPDAIITLVADRDATAYCEALARSISGVKVAIIPADVVPENYKADAYDLWKEKGSEAVIDCIKVATWPSVETAKDTQIPELAKLKVGEFISSKPPQQEFIVAGLIPTGVVGELIAAGGTGKSTLFLQLGMSVSSGVSFAGGIGESSPIVGKYGYDPKANIGGVLILSFEDDKDEVHRRVYKECQYHLAAIEDSRIEFGDVVGTWKQQVMDDLIKNLHILPCTGGSSCLISKGTFTSFLGALIDRAREIDNLKLIILDPLSRLHDGDENSSGDMTRVIEALEYIKEELGVTVLVAHHVGKGALLNNVRNQAAGRGSSALVDGARLVLQLTAMTEAEGKEFNVTHREYLNFAVTKSNYMPPLDPIWLRREAGGHLTQTYLSVNEAEIEAKTLDAIRLKVIELCKADDLHSRKKFVSAFGGLINQFKTGRDCLDGLVHKAITGGLVKQVKAELLKSSYSSAGTQRNSTYLLVVENV